MENLLELFTKLCDCVILRHAQVTFSANRFEIANPCRTAFTLRNIMANMIVKNCYSVLAPRYRTLNFKSFLVVF